MTKELKKATFAGGCFWCMQPPFREKKGVISAVSGYAGGTKPNPTYEEVSSGTTGHLESVQITYDPGEVTYPELLEIFWHQIDPTDPAGQFADKGSQYHTAIFYHDEEQKRLAEESKAKLDASKKFSRPVATEIRPFTNFYPAEEYHQDYDRKQPGKYRSYKTLSGRAPFIERVWGKEEKAGAKETGGPAGGKRVTIFATPNCTGCRAVKEFLKSRNVEFREVDMAADEEARNYVIGKTGHISSPIVQIGEEFVIGFDRKKMESLLGKGE